MRRSRLFTGAVFALFAAGGAIGIGVRMTRPASAAPVIVKNHKLYLADTTLGEKRISSATDVEILFDRSGGSILFGAQRTGAVPDSEDFGGLSLHVMRDDGGGERSVSDELVRAAFLDRGGKTIYYTTAGQDLYQVDADLTGRKLLAEKVLSADLSPDGRSIVYQKLNHDWRPGQPYDRALGLTVLDLASGTERRISGGWEDFAPFWTPDSRKIIFFSRSPEGLASEFIVGADGEGRRQLTNVGQRTVSDKTVPVPSEHPSWSPDGKSIIYESDREIWVNGFSPQRDAVAFARSIGYGKHPEWDADGKSVHVLVGKNGDFNDASVVRIRLDGSLIK